MTSPRIIQRGRRRGRYIVGILGLGCLVVIMTLLQLLPPYPTSSLLAPATWAALLCPPILVVVWLFFRERRVSRELAEARGQGGVLCEHCGYPLVGASRGTCPECGEAFELDTLKEKWAQWKPFPFERDIHAVLIAAAVVIAIALVLGVHFWLSAQYSFEQARQLAPGGVLP